MITTLIGDGVRGYTGDGGPAAAAQLNVPKAVGVTPAGAVLIADEQNNRIRYVGDIQAPANSTPPLITGAPAAGQQLTAAAGGWSGTGPVISYQWQRCDPVCSNIVGASSKSYSAVNADVGRRFGSGSAGQTPRVLRLTTRP